MNRSVVAASAVLILAMRVGAQGPNAAGAANWPLHNLDLAGSRFSPLDQIKTSNVQALTPRWLFQHGVIDGVSNQTTPVVVDGIMYVTDARGSVYALDAADGHLLWTYDVTDRVGGGRKEGYVFRNRGVCYSDGVVYTAAGSFLFALDARTGKPMAGFGKNGQASVILDVVKKRFPEVTAAVSLGYWFTTAPQIHNGVIYIGSTRSESHIPGGHVLAVDAKTGAVLWHFNTIPQDEHDQGWELAGPTWVGGERNGGGIWETVSIDPELGLLYAAVGNPFGDSSKRTGTNLFTDSIIALTLSSGQLKWHYQQTHHDVWDYDSGNQPVLFEMQLRGQRVKALAEASKNGYLYILNRETGQPVHQVKETPVPTDDPRPGEHPWPTQPIPYTAQGKPMQPVSPVFPIDISPDRLTTRKLVPQFTPPGPNQISAPGTEGGANYGPISYSRQTGLLYVNAVDSPLNSGRPARGYFSAFDPTTGELVWQKTFDGWGQAGSVVTAGGLVFVGTGSNVAGYFFAYDAKTGDLLWKFNTGAGVFSSPSVYMVNGEEFVTVGSGGGERGRRGGDLILSFALPKQAETSSQANTYRAPRTADGTPNLTGIWQTMNTANWDLQAHEARRGPVVALAAAFSIPPGPGVVEGNEIPYLPAALAKKKENGANWMTRDPEIKCYMPGVPRATYMPYPFQIVQSSNTILMAYEFASASRIVRMQSTEKSPAPAWMGWSIGRWEGETLVIDVADQMEDTWFDRAGNFHSDALHVVERFTAMDPNTLNYEVTIEDPKVFTRPWKINMLLYRRLEKNAQLMEYKCVPFAEELMYGHLRKKPTTTTSKPK